MKSPQELAPLLDALGGFNRSTIHVAGSKGKGSTCYLLSELLRGKGFKVGLYVSPVIEDEREAVQLNGEWISEADYARLSHDLPEDLSAFEAKTLLALRFFEEQACNYVVLETGWGGAMDATNVVESKVLTILTHVELEHQSTLGHTLEAIVEKKLGIARPGVPLLTSPTQDPAIFEVMKEKGIDPELAPSIDAGRHHPEAVGLAVHACELLNLTVSGEELALIAKQVFPGRFDIHALGPHILILDGAHTPHSVAFVREQVEDYMNDHGFHEVFWGLHFLSDKDESLSENFPPSHSRWIPIEDERAGHNPAGLPEVPLEVWLSEAHAQAPAQLFVALGSFKLVGAIKKFLASKH